MQQMETLRSTALAEPENEASPSPTPSANAFSMAGIGGKGHDQPDENAEGDQHDQKEYRQGDAFAAPTYSAQTKAFPVRLVHVFRRRCELAAGISLGKEVFPSQACQDRFGSSWR